MESYTNYLKLVCGSAEHTFIYSGSETELENVLNFNNVVCNFSKAIEKGYCSIIKWL